jgi:hypothetical protein
MINISFFWPLLCIYMSMGEKAPQREKLERHLMRLLPLAKLAALRRQAEVSCSFPRFLRTFIITGIFHFRIAP